MNSQAWKKPSSCTPETRSATAMNSAVVPVAVPVRADPRARDPPEGVVADGEPQRVLGHGAAM